MLSYRQFLLEKTFDISGDVDRLYNKVFKKIIDKIQKDKFTDSDITSFNWGSNVFYTNDSIFKSKNIKKAHEIQPARIECSIGLGYGMQYMAKSTMGTDPYVLIRIDISKGAIDTLRENGWDLAKAVSKYSPSLQRSFRNEFTASKIKSSIYHELSHWLDDTFHNKHINKSISKALEIRDTSGPAAAMKFRAGKSGNISFTDIEINAQIHNLKQMKRDNKKIWDEFLRFTDAFKLNPSLDWIYQSNPDSPAKQEWLKKLFKRAHRENLLGKKMKKI